MSQPNDAPHTQKVQTAKATCTLQDPITGAANQLKPNGLNAGYCHHLLAKRAFAERILAERRRVEQAAIFP